MKYVVFLLVALAGYLLGSLNSSLVIGKFYGVDIRKHGSGNAGATNMLRTLGKKAALFTSLGDFFKGIIACIIGYYLYMLLLPGETNYGIGLMISGLACILGHNWPVFFRFKGGKGVLTSLAVMIMAGPFPTLLAFAGFLIMVLLTRYISLSSIFAAVILPVIGGFFGKYLGVTDIKSYVIFTTILGLLVIFRHRSNIKRLINGTESKFGMPKAGKEGEK